MAHELHSGPLVYGWLDSRSVFLDRGTQRVKLAAYLSINRTGDSNRRLNVR
ncbi:hypothetical protein [Devosia sp. DBB001]|nr:hypothetical protein [Devosia sp. DBB001]